jgi:hypothetical protein
MRRQKYKYFFDIEFEAPATYYSSNTLTYGATIGREKLTIEVARTTRPIINDGVLTIITQGHGLLYMPWARIITIKERTEPIAPPADMAGPGGAA